MSERKVSKETKVGKVRHSTPPTPSTHAVLLKVGVLAFHGDVSEHIEALNQAAQKLKLAVSATQVRTKQDLLGLDGLIIPGGESTTLYKLCEREGMFEDIKKIRAIFGTCAGAIMLAKTVLHKIEDQKTLELMDIEVDRNAYGRQSDSFSKKIDTSLGSFEAVFIRAPKIVKVGATVEVIAKDKAEILACTQKVGGNFYLAASFHPELSTTIFHEYFLKSLTNN